MTKPFTSVWRGLAAGLAVALWGLAALAADGADAVFGVWLDSGGKAQVEIVKCGERLCGQIVWLKKPLDKHGNEKLDKHNPDQSLRTRKLLGLQLLSDFKHTADGVWEDGKIYNPEDGDTYHATLKLDGDGTLKLRGYVGIPLFGRTRTWTRVTGRQASGQ